MVATKKPAKSTESVDDEQPATGWMSRERASALTLILLTLLALYLCYLLALPFLAPLAWSGALAIVAHPMHAWIARRIPRKGIAAGIAVFIVAVGVVGPALFIVHRLIKELAAGVKHLQANAAHLIERYPQLRPAYDAVNHGKVPEEARETVTNIVGNVPVVVSGSLWFGAQLLITFFMLFYFFRDRAAILHSLKRLLPLSSDEERRTLGRIEDTVFATIYGSITVALVQGTLGGLMFWVLGISTPLLWGVVMALLAIVPMLGTFVVWLPTAAFLAIEGDWMRAGILAAWGGIAIALVDNLLYPLLVGKRLRLHPLLVFIAIVGGLSIFGAAGVVLGPVILSVTEALLEIWRSRTADGGTLEEGAEA